MKKRLIMASAFVLVFGLGALVGYSAPCPLKKCDKKYEPMMTRYDRRGDFLNEPSKEQIDIFKKRMEQKQTEQDRRLNFSSIQQKQAKAIREQARKEMDVVMEKIKANKEELKTIRENADKKYEAILNETQKIDYERIKAERKAEMEQYASPEMRPPGYRPNHRPMPPDMKRKKMKRPDMPRPDMKMPEYRPAREMPNNPGTQ